MRFRLAGLLLLSLLPIAFSAPINLTFAVPAVAVIVIAMLAVTNMLANAISNPQLTAWAKTELREFLAGVFLIALVIALFISSNALTTVLTGSPDPITKAQSILDTWIGSTTTAYNDVIDAATLLRIAASYSSGASFGIPWVTPSYQTGPLGGVAVFLVPLNIATQGLSNVIYLSEALRLLLAFMQVIGPIILLPLSFCLRLIPFTRRLGNTMIALSLAGMVLLPLSVIVVDIFNGQIPIPQPHLSDGDKNTINSEPVPVYTLGPLCEFEPVRFLLGLTDLVVSIVTGLACGPAFAACQQLAFNVVYRIIILVFSIANAVIVVTWEAVQNPSFYGGHVFDALRPFLTDVSNFVMVVYLDFVFIALLTFAGARSLSAALGGEWYMAGVQRLV